MQALAAAREREKFKKPLDLPAIRVSARGVPTSSANGTTTAVVELGSRVFSADSNGLPEFRHSSSVPLPDEAKEKKMTTLIPNPKTEGRLKTTAVNEGNTNNFRKGNTRQRTIMIVSSEISKESTGKWTRTTMTSVLLEKFNVGTKNLQQEEGKKLVKKPDASGVKTAAAAESKKDDDYSRDLLLNRIIEPYDKKVSVRKGVVTH